MDTECRPAAGPCDVAEVCDGETKGCPDDVLAEAGTLCRASAGDCDVAEYCDGETTVCPADVVKPANTLCRASAGTCDVAEYCTGASGACPVDAFKPDTTICRPATGPCDLAEYCSGSSAPCPFNKIAPAGYPCNDENLCTRGETCDGTGTSFQNCGGGEYIYCYNGGHCNGTACDCPAPYTGPSCEFCAPGYLPVGNDGDSFLYCEADRDGDGIVDSEDNCPEIANPDQEDADEDGWGDPCDCKPHDGEAHADAYESCNGRDDNCNGEIDEGIEVCPGDILTINGQTYLFLWWNDGYWEGTACPYGYMTVAVNDAVENAWLSQQAYWYWGGGEGDDVSFWLGLQYASDQNKWWWDSADQPSYRRWAPGYPDTGEGEYCVQAFSEGGAPAQWYSIWCGNYNHWICEACGDDSDGDGWGDRCDCAPNDPDIYPYREEYPNGKDDNCNGLIDDNAYLP